MVLSPAPGKTACQIGVCWCCTSRQPLSCLDHPRYSAWSTARTALHRVLVSDSLYSNELRGTHRTDSNRSGHQLQNGTDEASRSHAADLTMTVGTSPRTALISGIGIAGPALAFWMLRAGFVPTLIERAPRLRTGG